MRGLMKVAPGVGNVELRELAQPEPRAGQALIEVSAAGICGTDLHIYHDEFKTRPPVVMGHEVAGRIVAVGDGVAGLASGDRVTTETYFSTCEACRYCRDGQPNLCPERRSIGSAVNGGFTRFLVVPARNVHLLPPNVDDFAGALTEPLACVVHGALERTRIVPGDLAIVAGPGAIGLLTMQVARSAGARVVVLGTARDEHRLELARRLGADYTLNVEQDDAAGLIDELSDGGGADVVYECSGAGPAAQQLLGLVRRAGQYAQIGLFGRAVPWDLDQICYKELRVGGSNASGPGAWPRALALMASGAVQTGALITGRYPLSQWRDAFDAFEQRSGVKQVLQPEG